MSSTRWSLHWGKSPLSRSLALLRRLTWLFLLDIHSTTLPAVLNDPSSSAMGTEKGGMAVDRDLLVAHALPHM